MNSIGHKCVNPSLDRMLYTIAKANSNGKKDKEVKSLIRKLPKRVKKRLVRAFANKERMTVQQIENAKVAIIKDLQRVARD